MTTFLNRFATGTGMRYRCFSRRTVTGQAHGLGWSPLICFKGCVGGCDWAQSGGLLGAGYATRRMAPISRCLLNVYEIGRRLAEVDGGEECEEGGIVEDASRNAERSWAGTRLRLSPGV